VDGVVVVHVHGAELEHHKRRQPVADPDLAKEHRSRTGGSDADRDDGHHRRQQDEEEAGQQEVKRPFEGFVESLA
jgi:hypothetical protein